MIDLTKLKELMKGIEDAIEERFATQAGYQQVKAALEGTAEKVDTRSLVVESRAVFAGANKPEILAVQVIAALKENVDLKMQAVPAFTEAEHTAVTAEIEKKRAIIERRASKTTYEAGASEGVVAGRLVAADGITPVAGAAVVIRGVGPEAEKVVAEGVTDANGEYVIRMDEEVLKRAPRRVIATFTTRRGEKLLESGELALAKGKSTVLHATVAEERREAASALIQDVEERRQSAMLDLAELKRKETEIELLRFQTEKSAGEVKAMFDAVGDLFKE